MKQTGEKRGEKIPGSRFVRDFCNDCGTPMRVVAIDIPHWCEDCDPKPSISSTAATRDDISPWQENAIRDLEDNRSN